MPTHSPVFKSAQGAAEFLAAYDAALSLWPVPFEHRDIATPFGTTHVIVSGPATAPPLVLLHCALMTSAIWSPVIEILSSRFRCYAVDVIGDVGRTVPAQPPEDGQELAQWLAATLDGLDITTTRLLGWSFGGFVAANFAIEMPARIERLALLAPFATFVTPGLGFLAGMLPLLFPTRRMSRWFESRLCFAGSFGCPEYSELLYQRFRNGRVLFKAAPRVFSDTELQQLTMPTLLLVGKQEFLYDGSAAAVRAQSLLPQGEVHLLPLCNHAVVTDQTDAVRDMLEVFLSR